MVKWFLRLIFHIHICISQSEIPCPCEAILNAETEPNKESFLQSYVYPGKFTWLRRKMKSLLRTEANLFIAVGQVS